MFTWLLKQLLTVECRSMSCSTKAEGQFNTFYNRARLRAVAPEHWPSFIGLARLSTLTWLTCVEGPQRNGVSRKRGHPHELKGRGTQVIHGPPNPPGAHSAVWWPSCIYLHSVKAAAYQAKMSSLQGILGRIGFKTAVVLRMLKNVILSRKKRISAISCDLRDLRRSACSAARQAA